MGLLTGGTKRLFGSLLAPLYPRATLTSRALTYANNGTITIAPSAKPCRARVDSATEKMRTADGFTETDRAIMILADTVTAPVTTDHEVEILDGDYAGSRWSVASVDRPPGASYFLCRGTARG